MKNAILFACLIFCGRLYGQTSYITATGIIALDTATAERYDNPTIFVNHRYDVKHERYIVTLGVSVGFITATAPIDETFSLPYTKSQIDFYTGSGSDETTKLQNALDQAVVDFLASINPLSTITIH